jgi:hypothetical protein
MPARLLLVNQAAVPLGLLPVPLPQVLPAGCMCTNNNRKQVLKIAVSLRMLLVKRQKQLLHISYIGDRPGIKKFITFAG